MSGVTAAGLAACNAASGSSGASSAAGIYTPGTYTATAKGMSEITATVTFDANTITKVELDLSGETESIGGAAKDKLIEQIMNGPDQPDRRRDRCNRHQQGRAERCGRLHPAGQRRCHQSCTAVHRGNLLYRRLVGEAPEIAESDIKQTVDCEVLVVGAGSSGSFAAAAAPRLVPRPSSSRSLGNDMASGIREYAGACGSKQQQEDGDDVSKKDAVCYLCNWSQGIHPPQSGTGLGR